MKKEFYQIPDFPEIEHKILKFWEENDCFKKLVEKNKNGKRFRFLDGPITANNPMGIHHAWGRTLKDAYIRYQAMNGKSCQYQNGFDAQGLWVEVEVEKSLGFSDKSDIEKYGMDKFTEACMARVKKFSDIITEQSKRLGQWMDWDNSYYTNTDLNITSIWHFLKVCHEKGWLVKTHRPMPWCPRCGTSLSDHEMAGSYCDMEHLSIFAKLPIKGTNDKMLLWTTTPWTLTANVALAVNPNNDYVRVKVKSDTANIIIGKEAIKKLAGDIVEVSEPFKGKELLGLEYETCFPNLSVQNFTHKIIPWEMIAAEEGTGVVHIAPGCGAEDYDLGKEHNLPAICPINEEGHMLCGYGEFEGFCTETIVNPVVCSLEKQNKLYKTEMYAHSYPQCWRCKTSVVFKLVDEWNINTDEIRPLMIEAIKDVDWEPEHLGKRMLDWLNNMGAWNISRKRFYGLPLPFYPCKKCGHLTVIGSKEELLEKSTTKSLDGVPHLHRPYIDTVKIYCEKCGAEVERVPEVGDCWLDAGITPFSTKKYFSDKEYFDNNFPSDLVLEMKEQIRLWFYSLLFMSVALTGKAPYKKLVGHSSVVRENGEKFSKTGYMIRFDEAAEKMGADIIRYLYSANPVGTDVRFGYGIADEARRKLMSLWNIYVFFNIYASIDKPDIENHKVDYKKLTHSDRWLLVRTQDFIDKARQEMDNYRTAPLIKDVEAYVDEVSNWYIRINRRRFWKSENKEDQMNAYWCLYQSLKALITVLAPIVPFITEYIYQNTIRVIEKDAPISIHHYTYLTKVALPKGMNLEGERNVLEETIIARNVITTAQRMRNEAQMKVKQPLQTLFINTSAEGQADIEKLLDIIQEELNIKEVIFTNDAKNYEDTFYAVNFRVAGRVLKGEAQKLKTIIDNMTQDEYDKLTEQLEHGKFSVSGFADLDKDLLEALSRPKLGFVVAKEMNMVLGLDTNLNDELIEEGFVRELIRQIQVLRKEADFAVEQRIIADIIVKDEFAKTAIKTHLDRIKSDILARDVENISNPDIEKTVDVQDYEVTIKLKK